MGPEFIDNRDGNTLAAALAAILSGTKHGGGLQEATPGLCRLDIASAFFSPAGFSEIVDHLGEDDKIRLMLGAEPPLDSRPPRRRLDETPAQFERRLVREGLANLETGLREERDRLPFIPSSRAALRRLIAILSSGRMEARRYERAVLHAKAYIFAPAANGPLGGSAGVIAGSSNLTRAGVTRNLELNLGRYNDPVVAQAHAWFNELWEEAIPFDLTELLSEVFRPWTPFEIFLRVLFQLYGGEVEDLAKQDQGLPLTSFQKHGAARALRLIEEIGGTIVADEVGLGKTFIAGEIMDLYVKRRQRCLLICPARHDVGKVPCSPFPWRC
jgi:PLD-like domain